MEHNSQMSQDVNGAGSVKSYVIGFILSIAFSIIPFIMVQNGMLPKVGLVLAVVLFATLQLLIQLVFFMHLNQESKPRLFSQAFWFALFSLGIIVGGSIWVMLEMMYYMHL